MAERRAVRWLLVAVLVVAAVACTEKPKADDDEETETGAPSGQTTGGDSGDADEGADEATDDDCIPEDDPECADCAAGNCDIGVDDCISDEDPECADCAAGTCTISFDQAECDAGTGPCVDASSSDCESDTACVLPLENQACHNFNTAGGNSEDRVFGQTFGVAPNSQVIGYFDVTDGLAPGAPAQRTAGDFVHADGSFVWVLPAYAEGEELTFIAVTVQGTAVEAIDFSTIVEPLDDPTTECDALPTQ